MLPLNYNYALQDLEEMKASAKPAWECVCPSREEEEEEEEEE